MCLFDTRETTPNPPRWCQARPYNDDLQWGRGVRRCPSYFAPCCHLSATWLGVGVLIERAAAFGIGSPGLGLGIGFSYPSLSLALPGYNPPFDPSRTGLGDRGAGERLMFQQATGSEDAPSADTLTVRRSGWFTWGRQMLFLPESARRAFTFCTFALSYYMLEPRCRSGFWERWVRGTRDGFTLVSGHNINGWCFATAWLRHGAMAAMV